MNPLTVFNFLMLPVVAAVWVFCWVHMDAVREHEAEDFRNLRILGYSYELLDASTQKPISTLAEVKVSQPTPGLQSRVEGSKEAVRVSGLWIGHPPQTITIKAPGYEPKVLGADVYTSVFQKLFLTRIVAK